MKQGFYLYLEDKIELLDLGDHPVRYPIGHLLLAFLDVDWAGLSSEAEALKGTALGGDFKQTDFYQVVCKQCGPGLEEMVLTPILGLDMLERNTPIAENAPELLKKLGQRFSALALFKTDIEDMVFRALDVDGEFGSLSSVQRSYLLRQSNAVLSALMLELYSEVSIQNRISGSGSLDFAFSAQKVTPQLLDKLKDTELNAYTFFCCDDVRALVLLEYDHMCAKGYTVRKCANCGRCFLPFSSRARYCDRIVEAIGKPCKDFAAAQQYRERVNADEARKLLAKRNNTYRMRVQRDPTRYPESEYQHWRSHTTQLLAQLEGNAITFEDFARQAKL